MGAYRVTSRARVIVERAEQIGVAVCDQLVGALRGIEYGKAMVGAAESGQWNHVVPTFLEGLEQSQDTGRVVALLLFTGTAHDGQHGELNDALDLGIVPSVIGHTWGASLWAAPRADGFR